MRTFPCVCIGIELTVCVTFLMLRHDNPATMFVAGMAFAFCLSIILIESTRKYWGSA
jgi:hypothetical protein